VWIQRPKRAVLGAGLLLVSYLLMFAVSFQTGQAALLRQGSPTISATLTTTIPIPTPLSASPTPSPTLEAVSYPQMLAAYKEVLETSRWVMTAFLGILTLSGLGALWLFQHGLKGIGEVQAKASELKSELESSKKQNEELRKSNEELEERLRRQSEEAKGLQEELEITKGQARLVQREVKRIIPRLETLANVDTYAMRLFSADSEISRVARRTLIELSKDEDPVVRRECVRVFGAMPNFPECFVDLQDPAIISRLQEMALKDSTWGAVGGKAYVEGIRSGFERRAVRKVGHYHSPDPISGKQYEYLPTQRRESLYLPARYPSFWKTSSKARRRPRANRNASSRRSRTGALASTCTDRSQREAMHDKVNERPFAELPAALVEEVLDRTEGLGRELLRSFAEMRAQRQTRRAQLAEADLLRREADLSYVPIPTTCGVDGSYAIERLLTTDLVAAAALAVEGLTPPSETRHWPEPRHLVYVGTEGHDADTGTVARAVMIGMELQLAAQAPHEVVFVDGSLTTPLIYFNQALNKAAETPNLHVADEFLQYIREYLEAYHAILVSRRSDRCWIGVPKYTTRREIGRRLDWPEVHDDRGLLTNTLEPGEFTHALRLQKPAQPWHLNIGPVCPEDHPTVTKLSEEITGLLAEIHVLYYRPYSWLPALRLEMSRAVAETPARLAAVIHGVRHQCGSAAILEPYPLYMADRMVKHLARAVPTFRQVTSQRLAETYDGDIGDVFLGLHGYRTESGR